MTVIDQVRANFGSMSPNEQRVAAHLLRHGSVMTFASASQVARMLGVSASTVVRFAQQLGYSGYVELQERWQQEFDESKQLVAVSVDRADLLEHVIERDGENIASVARNQESIAGAAAAIAAAQRVWFTGGRSSESLARIGSHFMNLIRPDVRFLDVSGAEVPDQLVDMSERDVMVAVSMSRYTKDVVRLVRLSPPRAATVLITDEHASPLLPDADWVITFSSRPAAIFRSLTAGMATVQALVAATAREVGKEAVDLRIAKAEELWKRFETFMPTESPGAGSSWAEASDVEATREDDADQGPDGDEAALEESA